MFDASLNEIARGKPAKGISVWEPASHPGKAVDGNYQNNNHPEEFHVSGADCGDFAGWSWWEVDLGNPAEISKVTYYNRHDCC